jgi:ketosteroid isomerase-like protein
LSQADLDVALAFIAAYNARDIDATVDLFAVDVNVFPDASVFPESGSLVGRDEFRGFVEETWSVWTTVVARPKEVLDIGDGRVFVRADWGGTGMASGIETYQDLSAIHTIRDGQISRAEYFFDHDKALDAVWLTE